MGGVTPNFEAHLGLAELASRYVDVESMPWEETRPGMRAKVLYKDNEVPQALILIETDPGAEISEHEHLGLELTYVLEGSLEDDEGACTAGGFVWRPPGSRHTARTPNGARFLVLFQGQARTVATGRLFPSFDD